MTIDGLRNDKVSGHDGIPSEMIKNGSLTLKKLLNNLQVIKEIWNREAMSKE